MNGHILKVFNLNPHEILRVVHCALLLFLITFGIETGRVARDSFFLKMAGPDQIPYMYVLVGFLMGGASFIYSRFIAIMKSDIIFNLFLYGGALLLLLDWWLTRQGVGFFKWIPYVNFCVLEIFIMILLIHFWNHISDFFDSREGKRIFPLIGGAGLIGTMGGGIFTHQLSHYIGTVNLLLVWMILLLFSGVVVKRLNTCSVRVAVEESHDEQAPKGGFWSTLKSVWSLPLMRIMTYMALPMWIIIYVIEFHYFKLLNSVFPDIDQLTSFMGFFVMVTSFIGMLIQIGLTPRLLNRFGVGGTSVLYPFSLTLGAVALMFFNLFPQHVESIHELKGHMWLIPLARFCDVAIYFSIYESATQLVFYAVTPRERSQGRAFMSGIIIPVSIALSGLLLILLEMLGEPMHNLSFVALNLSFMLLIFSLSVGTTYMRALVQNLHGNQEKNGPGGSEGTLIANNTEMRFVLLQAISSRNVQEARYAFVHLTQKPDEELLEEFAEVIEKALPEIQSEILDFIVNHKNWVGDKSKYEKILFMIWKQADHYSIRQKLLRTLRHLEIFPDDELWPDINRHNSEGHLTLEIRLMEFMQTPVISRRKHILRPYYRVAKTSTGQLMEYLYIQKELGLTSFVSAVIKILNTWSEDTIPLKVFEFCKEFPSQRLGRVLLPCLDSFVLRQSVSHCFFTWFQRDPSLFDFIISGNFPDHLKRKCIRILENVPDMELIKSFKKNYTSDFSGHPVEWVSVFWANHRLYCSHPELSDVWYDDVLDDLDLLLDPICEQFYEELLCLNINVFYHGESLRSEELFWLNYARKVMSALIQCLCMISRSTVVLVLEQTLSKRWVCDPDQMEILEGATVKARKLVAMLENSHQAGTLQLDAKKSISPINFNWFIPGELFWIETGMAKKTLAQYSKPWILEYLKGSFEWGHCLELLKEADEDAFRIHFDEEGYRMSKQLSEIMNSLKEFKWFESMALPDLQWVAKNIFQEHFDSQTVIFNEGDKGTKAYFIKSGEVVITKNTEEGCLVLKRYRPGELFGEIACLTELNRTGTAKAVVVAELYAVSRAVLVAIIKSDPNFALKLCEALAEKVESTNIMTGKVFNSATT